MDLALIARGTSRLAAIRLVEVDLEDPEDEAVHGGPDAIAEASNARDHALRDALLVGVRVIGDVGADGRIADARHGCQQASVPDEPRLGREGVGGQLQHLEDQADQDALLAAKVLDENH